MADPQTALFRQYDTDYCNKSTDIDRKIGLVPSLMGDSKRSKQNEIEGDLRALDVVLKSMEMEARSQSPAVAPTMLEKVKTYKTDLAALKEKSRKAASAAPTGDAARAELGLGGDYYSTSAGQREKMLTATQKLEHSSANLNYAQGVLEEAQQTGADILVNLQGQRETILRSRQTLQGADDNIGKARKVLSAMARRVIQNKIIMFGVIGFLLFAIAIILYVKLKG